MSKNSIVGRLGPRGLRALVLVLIVALATGVVSVAGPPARAASSGDFTLTLNASDLGVDPAVMAATVPEIQAEIAEAGSLSKAIYREMEDYPVGVVPVDASAWAGVDFDGTVSLTADGTGMTITVPGAEIQTTAGPWASFGAWVAAGLAGYGLRILCIGALTASGAGAAVVGLVCTPLQGAVTGLIQAIIVHAIDGNLGAPEATVDIILKTLGGLAVGALWEKWLAPFAKTSLANAFEKLGAWLVRNAPGLSSRLGSTIGGAAESAGTYMEELHDLLDEALASWGEAAAGAASCDIYESAGTPCVAAHSMVHALYSHYDGPLYQVQRASDAAKDDIRPLSVGGIADAAEQDSFCAGTSCIVSKIYDQSPEWNDLTVAAADHAAEASALPVTIGGHRVYGLDITGQVGYRNNNTHGIATAGQPEGMYMVASGTHVNSSCCFDYGNAETSDTGTGEGHMDAVNLSTTCYYLAAQGPCTGNGPWVEADLGNGLFQGGNGTDTANTGNGSPFVTAMLKNDGQQTYAVKGGDSQSGGLSTYWNGALPSVPGQASYAPMHQEGAIVLGIRGDNSNADVGSWFEGVMTQGYPSDAADAAVQANIVASNYAPVLRVMIAGDSISQSVQGDWTWRYRLWQWFRAQNIDVDFVGPYSGTKQPTTPAPPSVPPLQGTSAPPPPPVDPTGRYAVGADPAFNGANFAMWGRQVAQDDPVIEDEVARYQPDMLLVELGFNDLGWFVTDPAGTLANMATFVNNARAANPNLKFAIANVPQRTSLGSANPDLPAKTDTYDQMLATAIPTWSTSNSPVALVNFRDNYSCGVSGCPAGYDGLHPNALGDYQIARAFENTLQANYFPNSSVPAIPTNIPARPISVPTGVVATPTPLGVTVTWDPIFGAYGYSLQYRLAGSSTWNTVSLDSNRYDLTWTQSGMQWEFQVRQNAGDGVDTPWSGIVSATANPQTAPPPIAISDFSTATGVDVGWAPPTGPYTDSIVEYEVIYLDKDTPGAFMGSTAVTGFDVHIDGLIPGHRYAVGVITWNAAGGGLPGPAQDVIVGGTAPPTPTNLQVTNTDPTTVQLTWNASPGVTGYQVWTRNATTGGQWQHSGNISGTNYSIAYLFPGTWNYQFEVLAVNGTQQSPPSIAVTPPKWPGY